MNGSNNRISKVIATLCFTSLAVAILVASKAVATGYELSIYDSTPGLFWPLLFICVIGGIGLIVYRAFTNEKGLHLGLVVGPLGLANVTILLLPVLRGYFLYASSDSLVHIGMGLDTTLTGHADSENFYPAIHILIVQLSQVCGMTLVSVGRFLPVFLNTVFIILITYLVGEASLPERGQRLLAFAFASAFLLNSLHVMLYPQVLSFFFVLLALYLRLNEAMSQRFAGKIALIIVLFVIPYSHPAPSLMVVFFLLVIELANALYRRMSGHPSIGQVSVNLPLISAITFFTWISSFILFDVKVNTLWTNLRTPFAAPQVEALENVMGEISTGNVVSIFLKMYGDSFLCLLLAMIGVLIVTKEHWSGKKGLSSMWALAVVFLASVPVQLLIFAGARSQTVGRLVNLNFAIFLSPVLAAYVLHQILRHIRRITATVISSMVLLTMWTIGMFGVYHSPWILQPSWQITRMDVEGLEWFMQNKDSDVKFSGLGYPYALPHTILGYSSADSREDLKRSIVQMWIDTAKVLPEGFGYDRFSTLGESMGEKRYLVITRRFQLAIADPYLSKRGLTIIPIFLPGFQPTDFAKLDQDPSVGKLYSNGELDIWYVNDWPGKQ